MNRSWSSVVAFLVGPITVAAFATLASAQETAEGEPRALGAGDQSVLVSNQSPDAERGADDFCTCVGENHSKTVVRIEQALAGRLNSQGLDFVDVPLEEVARLLQEEYKIPVQIDTPALDEIGLSPEKPISTNLHNVSLRSALRLMLEQHQLTYIIRDEVLLITTPEEAESQLITCVYDVEGLGDKSSGKSSDALVGTILACVATETWSANGGGEAEIRTLEPGLMIVSQTQSVHNEIRDLLAIIRNMQRDEHARADTQKSEAVVTRSYVLQIATGSDANQFRADLRSVVVESLPEESWSGRLADGQSVVLAVLPDRIVVRHKPSVQEKVEAILADSGIASTGGGTRATFGGGFDGGGGFGGGGVFNHDPFAPQ